MFYFFQNLDVFTSLVIQEYLRNPFLTAVMRAISFLGSYCIVIIASVVICLIIKKYRAVGICTIISVVIYFLFADRCLKPLIGRARPYLTIPTIQLLTSPEKSFSFPSSHTGFAFASGVILFIMLPKKIGIPILFFAFLMGFSRVYIGVHYLTDVLAGAFCGTVIALLTHFVYKKGQSSFSINEKQS